MSAARADTRAETPGDIAVAGGGMIGLTAAWRLAQQGWRVTVFDKGTLGAEASWAGAGMLAPGGEIDDDSNLAALALESRRLYPSFVAELETASGLAIDYQECGALDLAYSDHDADELERRAARRKEIGIRSKQVHVRDVPRFWPRVRADRLLAACFYPDDAIVDSREALIALAAACSKASVSAVQECPVRAVQVRTDAVIIQTDRGEEEFAAAVIAAGAWSGLLRVEGVAPIPASEPVKGHLIGYQQPEQTCNTILRHGDSYLLQRRNGLLIVGTSIERKGFDKSIDSDIAARLASEASAVLPHLADTSPSEAWTGLRPASDALHVGSWQGSRCYLAYGHYRNGILLAPVTGTRLADEITSNLGKRSFGSAAHPG